VDFRRWMNMILKYLKRDDCYSIDYKTRKSSSVFLNDYLGKTLKHQEWNGFITTFGKELDNVDNYHFFSAYQIIDTWFFNELPNEDDRKKWIDKLLYSTKVIWYAAKAEDEGVGKQSSIDIFMRLNSGKIRLTNAELIKALFLHYLGDSSHAEVRYLKQIEMVQQWDVIEHRLQDNEFWYFLNVNACKNDKATRIELIFDLISKKSNKDNEFSTFSYYDEEQDFEGYWKKINHCFYRLLEWYEDDELYHLVGFILTRKISPLEKLWRLADGKRKSEFKQELKKQIGQKLCAIFSTEDSEKIVSFDRLQYGEDNYDITTVLILFNIVSHQENTTRISFYNYAATQWSLEHIHAQHSKSLSDKQSWDTWYDEHKVLIESDDIPDKDKPLLQKYLDAWNTERKKSSANETKSLKIYEESLYKIVEEITEDDVHSLDNPLCQDSCRLN